MSEKNQSTLVTLVQFFSRAPHAVLVSITQIFSQIAAATVTLLGCLILAGWRFDIILFKSVLKDLEPTDPATAIGFILAGVSVWLLTSKWADRVMAHWIRTGFAWIITLGGAIVFINCFVQSVDLGIDKLLFRQALGHNRMPPNSALSWFLIGSALLFLDRKSDLRVRLAQLPLAVAFCISLVVLFGYAYIVPFFYHLGSYVPMPLPTALGFLAICFGIFTSSPEQGLLRILTSDTSGGLMARRLLPMAIVVPFVLGVIGLWGKRQDLYSYEFGIALFTLAAITILGIVVWWNAKVLNDLDATQQHVEEARRGTEEQFRQITENIREVFWMTDVEKTQMIYISPGYEEIWGRTCEKLYAAPRSWLDAVHPEDRARVLKAAQTKQVLGTFDEQYRIIRPGGSVRWIRDIAFPVKDPSGQVYRIAGLAEDITEMKRIEQKLSQLASIVEFSNDAIIGVNLDGIIQTWNPAAERIYGYRKEEVVGKPISILVPRDLMDTWPEMMRRILRGERLEHYETVRLTKDGTRIDVSLTGSSIRDTSGKVTGGSVIVRDITARKQMEELTGKKQEEERDFQEQLTVLHEVRNKLTEANTVDELCRQAIDLGRTCLGFDRLGIWFLDKDPRFLTGSFGTDESGEIRDERGKRATFAPESPKGQVLLNKIPMIRRPEGPLSNDQGQIVGRGSLVIAGLWDGQQMIGYIATDNLLRHRPITERQGDLLTLFASALGHLCSRMRTEEALEKQAHELAVSNAELEQFAYVASHDLQEPLRMVASYVQLLAKRYQGKLDSDADEFIEFAADGAKRMEALITDLLAYSRLGTQSKPVKPIDSQEVFDQVLSNLRAAIKESGATVTHSTLPTVMADDSQLVQLFQNLIGNAIKFCGKNSPKVRVEAKQKNSQWLFSVRDNGIGIDPQYLDRIFLIFQRLHNRKEYPGTGIGLTICKKIVERHGGRIWVESTPGKGSTFYFNLPAAGSNAQGEPQE